MNGNQLQRAVDTEQSAVELEECNLLPRNPYCSNEGEHCICRLPNVTLQPQWVTAKPLSLWKTFLVCLLACLIVVALVVLVLYFVHFGKPTTGTTIIIQADGKSSHIICIPGSTTSPASSLLPGSQGTLPSIPVTNRSFPTTVPPSTPTTNQTLPLTVHPSTPTTNQTSPLTVHPSTPTTNQTSPLTVPPSATEITKTTTVDHEVIIEYD